MKPKDIESEIRKELRRSINGYIKPLAIGTMKYYDLEDTCHELINSYKKCTNNDQRKFIVEVLELRLNQIKEDPYEEKYNEFKKEID